jgi:hypothetical protein
LHFVCPEQISGRSTGGGANAGDDAERETLICFATSFELRINFDAAGSFHGWLAPRSSCKYSYARPEIH